ncbi:MAG TPA: class I SAM-dependent methyltransferase [Planctomycetota bacterium]|nr:class I SAM-dependent methyltransferase [Planctomycetota bacterium]
MAVDGAEPEFPTSGINPHVYRWIEGLGDLSGRTVVDLPAGDGRASHRFARAGADVRALDLFPEFMRAPGVTCQRAVMGRPLPLADGCADLVLCQEGIEHVGDQLALLAEFNRVLRPGGTLAITTPSQSHLRARLAWWSFESEGVGRMPPSEVDSIWFDGADDDRLYFGHLFLLGAQKLLTLTRLAGFELVERRTSPTSPTACLLLPFAWPALALITLRAWLHDRNRFERVPADARRAIFAQHARLNLSPRTLLGKHLFWVLRKERDTEAQRGYLKTLTRAEQHAPG